MGVLFLGALLLRLWAIGWGLPYVEHPDEPVLIEVAVRMVREHDANPHMFVYPSFLLYVLAAVIRLHGWWGIRQGLYTSLQDIPVQTYLYTTSANLYLWSRATTAVLSALTIPMLYLLARRMFDARVGMLAALALMVAAFHVEHSHYLTTDVTTGLWVVISVFGAWGVVESGRWRDYALAGSAAGIAAGTKYPAGVIASTLVVAHALHWRRQTFSWPLRRLIAGACVSILVFLVTTPFALLDASQFLADLRQNSSHYGSGRHGDFIGRWQLWEYAKFVWYGGLFVPGTLLALGGSLLLFGRWPRQLLVLFGAIAIHMSLLLVQTVNFVRNVMPIFPLLLLLAAAGVVAFADRVKHPFARRASLLVLGLALLYPQAEGSFWLLRYWSRPHTMAEMAANLRRLPHGMLSAVEMNPVQWTNDLDVVPVERLTEHEAEWYRSKGFRYLVANSDYRTESDRSAYELLKNNSTVLAEYPERDAALQPGPGGALLDLGEQVEQMSFLKREIRFGDVVTLLGYEAQSGEPRARITPFEGETVREVDSGQSVQLNLYWRSLQPTDRDYTLFIHVVDPQGVKVAQRDLPLRYGDYPTSRWQPGELVIDRGDLALPPLPSGEYRLELGLYDAASDQHLPPQGTLEGPGPNPVLTTIRIK